MKVRLVVGLCFLVFLIGPAYSQTSPEVCSRCNNGTIKVATFNTDLGVPSPFLEERIRSQISYLSSQNLDVVCLQGIWDPAIRSAFINRLSSVWPIGAFVESNTTRNNCTDGCSSAEFELLDQCITNSGCAENQTGLEPLLCLNNNCSSVLLALSESCLACLGLTSENTLSQDFDKCIGNITVEGNSGNTTNSSSCNILYNGWSDVLLLSRLPMTNRRAFNLHGSSNTALTAISGSVNVNGSQFTVICTNLVSSPGELTVNNENNNRQLIQQLATIVANESTNGTVILMGDLGASLTFGDISGLGESNLNILQDNGLSNAYYSARLEPLCTLCTDNPLWNRYTENNEDSRKNYATDQIYFSFNPLNTTGSCVIDAGTFANNREAVPVMNNINFPGLDTDLNTVPLSSHYGVFATICAKGQGGGTFLAQETREQGSASSPTLSLTALVSLALLTLLVRV